MSIFEEVQQLFKNWINSREEYRHNSFECARQFANGFREYIDAPKECVGTRKAILTSSGENEPIEADGLELLTRDDDGFYKFYLVLAIDAGAFQKKYFTFVRFRIVENKCEVEVGGRTFCLSLDDDSACVPVYAFMVENIKAHLSCNPWENEEKQQIGFIAPRRG